MLFFIEYNNHEESGGRTHSLTYYKERNKIYWIETSWGGFKDIHGPFSNVSELKQLIESKHYEEPEADRYPLIQWGNPNNTKPGMDLNEYVSSCLRIHENNIFYGIEFIPTSDYYTAFHATDSIERHNCKMAKKYGKTPKTESAIFADIEII